jgi:CHAT domain-containing protein/tetratricopeptide (TPR) repeat protein
LKKAFWLVCLIFSFVLIEYSEAQNEDKKLLFQKFLEQYNAGDLVKAENTLRIFLQSKIPLTNGQFIAAYSNLGAIEISLGRYDRALEYNLKAESLISKNDQNSLDLAAVYNNRGYIYNIMKSYDVAIEYLEKSIRIYLNMGSGNKTYLDNLEQVYINISIAYQETKQYSLAISYLEKNIKLNSKYSFSDLSLTYLNMAKIYVKLANSKKAQEFYLKSITSFIYEHNKDYYRLADVYFDYGLLLSSEGKNKESLDVNKKAMAICLKNYGNKHTILSLAYKHLGDNYIIQNKYDSALYYYQKSLIAVVKDFNNPDIFANPSIDSSLFDIRLLDNLKSKAKALELSADEQKDSGMNIKSITKSLETMELALQLIDRIRNNYLSEDSRIYLAENEKETYLFATHLAYRLYLTTHDHSMGYRMYGIAQKAKAAILRNEITGNELLYSTAIPDSLREKQNRLSGNIAAYNNLIIEENRNSAPNGNKISLWKDALFEMNREKEKVTGEIEKVFPQFHDLIRKIEPVPVELIQKKLKKDETIIDYLLSNQYSDGKRKLFVFLISNSNLDFREMELDSLFLRNAGIIRKTANPTLLKGLARNNFLSYTGALNYMYINLIKPVEDHFTGKKLIIIPDEEIGWVPFDEFLKYKPEPEQADYEGLHYLINDYTFSYAYSSSLIFSKNSHALTGARVLAFSPDYLNSASTGAMLSSLKGAGVEIGSILKRFRGKSYSGEIATKANFIKVSKKPVIFHLAMHSMSDSVNSKYSYLIFDTHNLLPEEGKLYNYEISLMRIKTPMIVLSACNSGTGTLYSGEGIMSLARGFTLAGASSVIKTSWEINDEVSAAIISGFYFHLAEGKEKNEAMRLAKLDYLTKASPAFKNPYYWAAYEVLGDNVPVSRNFKRYNLLILLVVIAATGGTVLYYLRRRRINSDRSW